MLIYLKWGKNPYRHWVKHSTLHMRPRAETAFPVSFFSAQMVMTSPSPLLYPSFLSHVSYVDVSKQNLRRCRGWLKTAFLFPVRSQQALHGTAHLSGPVSESRLHQHASSCYGFCAGPHRPERGWAWGCRAPGLCLPYTWDAWERLGPHGGLGFRFWPPTYTLKYIQKVQCRTAYSEYVTPLAVEPTQNCNSESGYRQCSMTFSKKTSPKVKLKLLLESGYDFVSISLLHQLYFPYLNTTYQT